MTLKAAIEATRSKYYPLYHRALGEIDALGEALEESVKLQSHYAELLNMYDGGQRMTFVDAAAWRARLQALKETRT